MPDRHADALEVLLPDAAPQFWQRAQRLTTFLRLLSDDARAHGGASIAINLARARGEFERSAAARLVRSHEELLRHHLYALLGPDSFAHFGECEAAVQRAWSELEEERTEAPWLAEVPAPGESAQSVATRLLAGLERAGGGEARCELWRARLVWAGAGPRHAAASFEAWLERWGGGANACLPLRCSAVAGVVECLLDRGAVRAARARLEAEGPRAQSDARLRRLATWTRLLAGDEPGARAQPPDGPLLARGRLPRPLAELRARVAAFAPALAGQVQGAEVPRADEALCLEGELDAAANSVRLELGATLFSAWILTGPGRARLAAHSVAPAHRGRLRTWLDEREGACCDPREPEAQLLVEGGPRVLHRNTPGATALAQTWIEPASTLAVAAVGVCDARGEILGWLRLEFEHHLVPSAARLEQLARSWSTRLPRGPSASIAAIPARVEDETSIAAALLRSFADGLALKTAQRRWSAFELRDRAATLLAQAGGALEFEAEAAQAALGARRPAGEGRAVARAAATGRSVLFGECDPRLSLHPKAASGLAVPLQIAGRVRGVWLLESTRRRDFSTADVRRFEARAEALAPQLAAAQFRGWHRAHYGHDVFVAAQCAGLDAQQLIALAASAAPVALCGAAGAGRRMLARRLHFESASRGLALRRVQAAWDELEAALAPGAAAASLIVERAPDLSHAQQARLARLLEERSPQLPRVFVLFDTPLASACEQGSLAPELAGLLSRVELRVESLARRRCEIVPLAQLFAAHFALEHGRRPPQFDDDALALLWRQPWPGNVRELAQWMYRLALGPLPERVDADCLEALAARFGLSALRRLPSRNPDAESMRAALETTARRKGAWNKTRAALYLGWDPDTLQSRLAEAHIAPCELAVEEHEAATHPEPPTRAGDGVG